MKKLVPILILSLIACESTKHAVTQSADGAAADAAREGVEAVYRGIKSVFRKDKKDAGEPSPKSKPAKAPQAGSPSGDAVKFGCLGCGGEEYAAGSAPTCCGEKMQPVK